MGYISDLDWKTYFTDNTSESTDRDPYDDGQELDGHSPADLGDFGGQMPASVKAPGRHPLVPSYPDLKVEIGGMDVVAKCKIESTTTKEEGSSWSIIPVVLEKASVKWGKENKGGSACLFGFCVGGSTAKNYYNYEHETFVEMVNSTSGWSRETWSLATALEPDRAAKLKFYVKIKNDGTDAAEDVRLTFNVKIGDKIVDTVWTGREPIAGWIGPGEKYPKTDYIVIDSDKDGNEIVVTLDELKSIELGAPVSVELVEIIANVPWGKEYKRWAPYIADIEEVSARVIVDFDGEVKDYRVWSGVRKMPTPPDRYIQTVTLEDAILWTVGGEAREDGIYIGGQRVDGWRFGFPTEIFPEVLEHLSKDDNLLGVPIKQGWTVVIKVPDIEPPKIHWASYTSDMKSIKAGVSDNEQVKTVRAWAKVGESYRCVELTDEDGDSVFTATLPQEITDTRDDYVVASDGKYNTTLHNIANIVVPFEYSIQATGTQSPPQHFSLTVTGTGTETWVTVEHKYSGYICYWCFGSAEWECPSHAGWTVIDKKNPYGGGGNDGACCCPTGLYDSPHLVNSCDDTATYYCVYEKATTHTATVTATETHNGEINATEGEKDLGPISAHPQPQHGGSVAGVKYTLTCSSSDVKSFFSDTRTQTTTNPNAHVIVSTDVTQPWSSAKTGNCSLFIGQSKACAEAPVALNKDTKYALCITVNGTTCCDEDGDEIVECEGTSVWIRAWMDGNKLRAAILEIDLTSPVITIYEPKAKSYSCTEEITARFTATDDFSGIQTVTADLDGREVKNGEKIDLFGFALGEHRLNVTAQDKAGNRATKSVIFDVKPLLTILSPANGSTHLTGRPVNLNYTVSSGAAAVWQGYSLDGAVNLTTLYGNTTLTDLAEGNHTLTVYANDTRGRMHSSSVSFRVVSPEGGGLSVAVLPRLSSVTTGETVNLSIKIVSTENFDDTVHAYLTSAGLPAGYEADLAWFNWTSQEVEVASKGEATIPLNADIPAGVSAAGYKAFFVVVESTKWTPVAVDIGIFNIS